MLFGCFRHANEAAHGLLNWTMKDCDGRKPVISELLHYLGALAPKPDVASHIPAVASMATALVIGGYCKPNQPQPAGTEDVFARLRKGYEGGVEPKFTDDNAPSKLENGALDGNPPRN